MTWFVPGRIEVFGKHTDYAGGRSLLVASEQGVTAAASRLTEVDGKPARPGQFRATSTASPDMVELTAGQPSGLGAGHWGNYVQTVVDRLTLNFGPLEPALIEIDSTLPLASGMSSSSALIVAVALALADQNGLWDGPAWKENIEDRLDLAGYAATIENGADFGTLKGARGVGTFGGSQDHTGMLCCHRDQLTAFTFSPLQEHDSVPIPPGWTFVVAVSGVLAEKTGSALQSYNDVSLRVSALVDVWNKAHPDSPVATLAQAVASSPTAAEELGQLLIEDPELALRPDLMERLLAYVVEVGEAIPLAEDALRNGDVTAFGEAATLSHRNADANLHNQVPETNELQRLALELGAGAASAFGAGFGGSVWALVQEEEADEFAGRWLDAYLAGFPQHRGRASVLITRAGEAAHRV